LRRSQPAPDPEELREVDTKRLIALELVKQIDNESIVTKVGLERCPGVTIGGTGVEASSTAVLAFAT
jgi:hypothetical protein